MAYDPYMKKKISSGRIKQCMKAYNVDKATARTYLDRVPEDLQPSVIAKDAKVLQQFEVTR